MKKKTQQNKTPSCGLSSPLSSALHGVSQLCKSQLLPAASAGEHLYTAWGPSEPRGGEAAAGVPQTSSHCPGHGLVPTGVAVLVLTGATVLVGPGPCCAQGCPHSLLLPNPPEWASGGSRLGRHPQNEILELCKPSRRSVTTWRALETY